MCNKHKMIVLVTLTLSFVAEYTVADQVFPCESNANCTDDHCCVVLPWIPSEKGGVCAKHAQKGEICWPPHHDYSKYLFYCPCAKDLQCKSLEAVENNENMTFHMDICVTKGEAEEGKSTENPEGGENEDDEENGEAEGDPTGENGEEYNETGEEDSEDEENKDEEGENENEGGEKSDDSAEDVKDADSNDGDDSGEDSDKEEDYEDEVEEDNEDYEDNAEDDDEY